MTRAKHQSALVILLCCAVNNLMDPPQSYKIARRVFIKFRGKVAVLVVIFFCVFMHVYVYQCGFVCLFCLCRGIFVHIIVRNSQMRIFTCEIPVTLNSYFEYSCEVFFF